jgi:uncharacterized membrane protein
MFKQKPFPFSVLVLIVLIGIHAAGSYFSWYWTYSWFDSVVHILAGLWASSVFLWLASYLNQIDSLKEYRVKSFLIALVSAALIGVIWELLENFWQLAVIDAPNYKLNTALDLVSDIIGGVLAYLYFTKKTCKTKILTDNLHPFYNNIGIMPKQNEQQS